MAGIYGILSSSQLVVDTPIYNYFHTSTFSHSLNEELRYKNCIFGRSVISKFLNDRVLFDDEELIIGFEGLFYNKEDLKTSNTIKKWYQDMGSGFVEKIKGQFSGFIYDKQLDKLVIFNDHLSSKPLYIYKSDTIFIFASELKVITSLLSKLNIKKVLDYDAVYAMLTFGYMLNDITLEKNTKKLDYATVLEVDKNFRTSEQQYYAYDKTEDFGLSKKEIIEKIDELLVESVKQCWQKDDEYGYRHYSFLSGGLDSRVNVLLAKELGYDDVLTMTFSQSGSSDQRIAQKIADDELYEHIFYPLDNGKFLEQDLHRFVAANDGLVIFNGSAAGYDILSFFDDTDFGALHTGQIGDLLFGSYTKNYFDAGQALMSNQKHLLRKISFIDKYINKYKNKAELFGYEQRVINCTLNGDRTLSHFTDIVSPFYNRELIQFCLTIPDKYKKDEMIYLDWFNKKHRKISQYKWESAGVKPGNITIVRLAKKIKRYKNALFRRLKLNINDMNPFDVWLRKNKNIVDNLDVVFDKYIGSIENKELKKKLNEMYSIDVKYSHYGRNNKFLVATLLLAIDVHFGNKEIGNDIY